MFRLVITDYNGRIVSAVYENGKMVEVSVEHKEAAAVVGNIYVGRVENIVKNINAAFVEVSRTEKGYYPLAENPEHIFLNRKNTDKVCQGDLLLVQVEREALKTKSPMLSSKLEFTGKYVVLKRGESGIGISGKLTDVKLRKAVKKALKPFASAEYELIARTNCETLYEEGVFHAEELVAEVSKLISEYEHLMKIAPTRKAFSLLNGTRPEYLTMVMNARIDDLEEIITDDAEIYNRIRELDDEMINTRLRLYEDEMLPLNKLYNIDSRIHDALKERVWLKSGGYLVIQPTEALTVIDVNTGKFVSNKKQEEGFLKVNLEAAEEIGKQLRLRNYSGIIVVDFIDMQKESSREILLNTLQEIVAKDRIRTSVVDMTKLGLVEITRKKIRKPLHEQLKSD